MAELSYKKAPPYAGPRPLQLLSHLFCNFAVAGANKGYAGRSRRANARQARLAAAASPQITPCVTDIADDASIDAIRAKLDGPVKLVLFAAGLPVRGSADTIEPGAFAVGANIKMGGLVRLLRAVRGNLQRGSRFVTIAGRSDSNRAPMRRAPARSMPACSTSCAR